MGWGLKVKTVQDTEMGEWSTYDLEVVGAKIWKVLNVQLRCRIHRSKVVFYVHLFCKQVTCIFYYPSILIIGKLLLKFQLLKARYGFCDSSHTLINDKLLVMSALFMIGKGNSRRTAGFGIRESSLDTHLSLIICVSLGKSLTFLSLSLFVYKMSINIHSPQGCCKYSI